MARFGLRDAAGVVNGGALYEPPIGPETDDPDTKTINLERTALTSGVGFIRQQGAPAPTIKRMHGWIRLPEHLKKLEEFYNACAGIGTPSRTVWWRDLDGTEHEVLITGFDPQRKIGRSGGTGLGYVWQYTITMEVIS